MWSRNLATLAATTGTISYLIFDEIFTEFAKPEGDNTESLRRLVCDTIHLSRTTFEILKGTAEFKRDRTNIFVEYRPCCPGEVTTAEIIKKIYDIVINQRRLKVCEIAKTWLI